MADDPRLLQWRNLPMGLRLRTVARRTSKNKDPLFYRVNQFYNGSVSKHLSSQSDYRWSYNGLLPLVHNLAIGFVIYGAES